MATISILINSFNYSKFIIEAIESALTQTRPPDEIIVVDDGSTDETPAILSEHYGSNPKIKIIRQRNAGQLSAFVTGIEAASGDFLFFLDADDKYEPIHLESVERCFMTEADAGFVFTAHRMFGQAEGVDQLAPQNLDLGYSVIATLKGRIFIGSSTSTVAIRRNVALTLLPAMRQAVHRWRIRADDCLVFGASLAGARKFYLANPTVLYRIHGNNGLFGKSGDRVGNYVHGLRRDTFAEILCGHLGLGPSVRLQAVTEFLSIKRPTRAHLREYIWLHSQCESSLWPRLRGRITMELHYRKNGLTWDGIENFKFKHS